MRRIGVAACVLGAALMTAPVGAAPVHTTYLWHMHQPIYWPALSAANGRAYETAFETIQTGHSQNDEASIFDSDDRVQDYQGYPKAALGYLWDLPDAGAQISFAGALIENIASLAAAGWNAGRYAPNWHQANRDAMSWTTSGGRRRLDPVVVGAHHAINPLVDDAVFRRDLAVHQALSQSAWPGVTSKGFFPAEMCFSTRLIPALLDAGVEWAIVPDIHIARACADYPYAANQDNTDPPNRADRINPAQGSYQSLGISRGVTTKVPVPYGLRPHLMQHVDPATGQVRRMIAVPAANGMSWNEGYGLYGTGEIDAIASQNDPARPMLIVFAHDGDNAWSGGHSYYHQNVTGFSHAAANRGYEPTTIEEFLADHPVDPGDVVHVEDGGWVNADGDFGSPQFINWNWPLVNASGQFDIPAGWAEDQRNWAVLTAATHRVLAAESIAGAPNPARIAFPLTPGTTALEQAWHFLLAGHESGTMYYGASLDMEVKATLACNRATQLADALLAGGPDTLAPTIWLPQRLPWNPGGKGGGSLWGYPGGSGADMSRDFWVYTFVHDVSGCDSVRLVYRLDADGVNPLASTQNETYAGGGEVGPWQRRTMTRRPFPAGDVFDLPEIDFPVLPAHIADQFHVQVAGLSDVLVDYYVEATDAHGRIRRSPIQHVYVGTGAAGGGDPAVSWAPAAPTAGGTLTITYDPVAGALPDATDPVRIHIGHSGWTGVLSPDPVMTRNPQTQRFEYTYSVPSEAVSVDFVFTDGAGQWDNHQGADWHVPVTGSQPPPHVIDGVLDPGLEAVAACGTRALHADYDGRWLYLAAPPASAGLDHFLFVAHPDSARLRASPWSKADSVTVWNAMVGHESSNGWSGWFRPDGSQPATGAVTASGSVLEARLDLRTLFASPPTQLRIAFGAYATADGGTLTAQVPCGDGDARLEPAERVGVISSATLSAPEARTGPTRLALQLLSANPTRGRLRARVEAPAGSPLRLDLLDIRGAVVATLHEGPSPGRAGVSVSLAPEGSLPAGVYFLAARSGRSQVARRVVLLP